MSKVEYTSLQVSLGQPYWVDTMKAGQNEDGKLARWRERKRDRQTERERGGEGGREGGE